jgi:hypothetical protein
VKLAAAFTFPPTYVNFLGYTHKGRLLVASAVVTVIVDGAVPASTHFVSAS